MGPYIKYFFIILCSSYVFKKLLKLQVHILSILVDIACTLVLTLMIANVNRTISWLIFVIVLLFCLINGLRYKLPINTALVSGIISFGLSYLASVIAAIIVALTLDLLHLPVPPLQTTDLAGSLVFGILQLGFVHILFRFSRLKNGMPFLQQNKAGWFGVFLSLIMLHIAALLVATPGQKTLVPFFTLILVEGGFILILWWRQKILERYNERMRRKQLEDMSAETQQVSAERSVLKLDNSEMARLLHENTKMVKALNTTAVELLQAAEFKEEGQRQKADAFIKYIAGFSEEYSHELFVYHNHARKLPETGLVGVDAMLAQMQQSAFQAGIDFDFSFSGNVRAIARDTVNEVDLARLIGDLVQNAFVAVGSSGVKTVVVYLSPSNSGLCLDVMDSGQPFSEEVLAKLGKERVTSHANSGGSGIGMMTVFETLRKYDASFILTQYIPGEAFSKKLSIVFDGQNRFIIEEDRPEVRAPKETGRQVTLISP